MANTIKAFKESDWDTDIDFIPTNLITGPGNLCGFHLHNPNPAIDVYIQFFNVPAASVTLGTTTPYRSFEIPAGGSREEDINTMNIHFNTAISYAVSTTTDGGLDPTSGLKGKIFYRELGVAN